MGNFRISDLRCHLSGCDDIGKDEKRKEKAEKKTKQTVLPAQAFESDEEEADDLPEEEQPTAASDDPCNKEEQPPFICIR